MKVTKEKAAENREALVRAAGRLFRERGIDGVGVAEISKAAGLTHGALYAQFPSKDALAAEAFAYGFNKTYEHLMAVKGHDGPNLAKYLDFLLSPWQRDNIAVGCPLTASASEVGRQDETVSARFADSFLKMVAAIEAVLGDTASRPESRQRALAIIAAEIGAIAVARATAKSHPRLSNEVLSAVRHVLEEVGDKPKKTRRKKTANAQRS